MAIESYFFNAWLDGGVYDRTYSAEDFTSYLNLLVSNGVFINPSSQLKVRSNNGMSVIVNAGSGWVNGHKMTNTSDYIVDIKASDVLLDRIDRIIFYLDMGARNMGIEVLQGVASSSPVAPTITRNEDRYEMSLALVRVNKQTSVISESMITDTRYDRNVCGVVKGLVEEIDTTDIFAQYNSTFNDWFSQVKETLATSTLIRKYEARHYTTVENEHTFNVNDYVPNFANALDILEVYVNGFRLASDEYVMNGNVVTLNNELYVIGTEVSFVVYKSIDGSNAEGVVELVDALTLRVNALEAKKNTTAVVTLSTGGWVASGDVYVQTVNVPIVETVNDVLLVSPVENVPVRATGQGVGTLTFTAYRKLTSAVTVNIVKVGV